MMKASVQYNLRKEMLKGYNSITVEVILEIQL